MYRGRGGNTPGDNNRGRFSGGFRGGFRGSPGGGGGRNIPENRFHPWKENNQERDRFNRGGGGNLRGNRAPPPSFGGRNDNTPKKDLRNFGGPKDIRGFSQPKDNRKFTPSGDIRESVPPNNIRDSEPAKENRESGQANENRDAQLAKNINDVNNVVPPNSQPGPLSNTDITPKTIGSLPINQAQRTNDVEIIVTHKILTEYSEFIERKLKDRKFNVDLLFPNEEVPLPKVLGNIAHRGTLYALIVTPQSEEHRSVTVNILHGQTQEHRNMPIDDALSLIFDNFNSFLKGERAAVKPGPGAIPITPAGIPLDEKHPESIQTLLNIVVENRPIDSSQYDKLIDYFQEKKDSTTKDKNSFVDSFSVNNKLNETALQQNNSKNDLQNRIQNILKSKFNADKTNGGQSTGTSNVHQSSTMDSRSMENIKNMIQNTLSQKI